MSRFGGLCLNRDLQFLRPEASLVLIYRPNVAGMKGRVDLAQPVKRTPDLRKGKNAVQARKKLTTDVYREGVLTVRQCQNWFAKFRSGNFDVEDIPRSGRQLEADKDAIKALLDANRRITTREIELRLNLSNLTVYDHLKGLGLSSKLDLWVPHVLTERNLCRRIDVCDSLHKRHENDPFLKRIITGDKKRS
ncbi:mariner transposase [Trichonephila clavipes]|nr:mariner transposase [Trichonephila clavipes]